MDTLALTPTEENLWWGAIIGGFVIVLAVAALLTVLVVLVGRIDRRVVMVRDTLKAAAANKMNSFILWNAGARYQGAALQRISSS